MGISFKKKGSVMSGDAKTGASVNSCFKVLKASSHFWVQSYFTSLCSSLVIGWAILEKSGMKRR